MVKTKLAILLDSILITLAGFFIFFVWINSLTENANLSLFFSIMISAFTFCIIFYLFRKNTLRVKIKNSSLKFITDCINYLTYSSINEYVNFLTKLLNCKHIDNFIFKIKNIFVYINLKYEVSDKDFQSCMDIIHNQKTNNSTVYFLTKSNSKSFENIIQNSQYSNTLLNIESLIKIMDQKKLYPIKQTTYEHKNKMSSLSEIKKRFYNQFKNLSRKQFIHIFLTGISLLFISLITPFPVLYIIFGSLFLLLSIICIFKKNQNNTSSSEIFINLLKK